MATAAVKLKRKENGGFRDDAFTYSIGDVRSEGACSSAAQWFRSAFGDTPVSGYRLMVMLARDNAGWLEWVTSRRPVLLSPKQIAIGNKNLNKNKIDPFAKDRTRFAKDLKKMAEELLKANRSFEDFVCGLQALHEDAEGTLSEVDTPEGDTQSKLIERSPNDWWDFVSRCANTPSILARTKWKPTSEIQHRSYNAIAFLFGKTYLQVAADGELFAGEARARK